MLLSATDGAEVRDSVVATTVGVSDGVKEGDRDGAFEIFDSEGSEVVPSPTPSHSLFD